MIINARTCIECWKSSLRHIIEEGSDFIDTDNRECREVMNLVVNITEPEKDYDRIVDAMKRFDWIYPSSEELSSIMFNKEDLAVYEFSYGPRIFNYAKKDQVNDYIIPLLRSNPNTRRAVISLFDPKTDSDILNKNVPSLLFIHFRVTLGKLNCTCLIRSNDFFIGWPGNIYQIYLLQRYVADKVGMKTGVLSTISCSAHVFHEHFENVKELI